MGGQGGLQGPLHRRGPVQGRGQGVQGGGQGHPVLGSPAQDGVHQALVGDEAQLPVPRQLDRLVHGGVVAHPGQPGQLRQTHGQGHPGAQGDAPGRVLEVGLHPGLEAAPAAQAEAQEGLSQGGVLAQAPVPDIRHPAAFSEDLVQGVGDMDAGGRRHGSPSWRENAHSPMATRHTCPRPRAAGVAS